MKLVTIPNEIDDNWIISTFYPKGRYISNYRNFLNDDTILKYLSNRYDDSDSIEESLYRIVHHIDIKPVCEYCGNKIQYKNRSGFKRYCCCACANYGSADLRKENSIKKWGVESPNMAEDVKNKVKQHFLDVYGVPNPGYIKEVIQKRKNTIILNNSFNEDRTKKIKKTKFKKYGNANYVNPEKAKLTCMSKYGESNVAKCQSIKDKMILTNIKKWGVPFIFNLDGMQQLAHKKEALDKKYNTMKLRNSFNTSKIEIEFKQYLEDFFPNDFIYQYKSKEYPYNCDFYIISLNLYIEIQGSWTHGGHPFNPNDKNDIAKLETWKTSKSLYCKNAIKTWTERDVKKRNIAKENNLNYLEIFSISKDEVIQQLNSKIEEMNIQLHNSFL